MWVRPRYNLPLETGSNSKEIGSGKSIGAIIKMAVFALIARRVGFIVEPVGGPFRNVVSLHER